MSARRLERAPIRAGRTTLGVDSVLLGRDMHPGDVAVEDGRVVELGLPADGRGYVAAPGFVDIQVNGFAGVDFARADEEGYRKAGQAMAETGVTSFQPTLVSLPWDAYAPALQLAESARSTTPGMVGIHLEGPFLTPERRGAHEAENLLQPTPDRLEELAGHMVVTWVTLAPELDGALSAIGSLRARGIRVALGHSDASAETTRRAIDAGAVVITHLFNGQSPLRHRSPGIPGVALDDERVGISLIVDNHHLAPEVTRLVFKVAADRTALITDAISVAGVRKPTTTTTLAGTTVLVDNNRATLKNGTLAGSLLSMDLAVRNAVDVGVSPTNALFAASSVPARRLGLEAGELSIGKIADVVVLDPDLQVVRTLRGGVEIYHR